MSSILVLNSLDARYGSTYRIRAFYKHLNRLDSSNTRYSENGGSAFEKGCSAVKATWGHESLLLTQKFNPITLAAIFVAKIRGKKVIVDWDDFDPGFQAGLGKKLISRLCEWIGPRFVDAITTHSLNIERVASRHAKTFMVSPGFDHTVFVPDIEAAEKIRRSYGISKSQFLIAHLCTFTTGGALDIDVILDAFAKVENPNAVFMLIGGGPLEPEIRAKVTRLNLSQRTIFTGLLTQEQVASHLSAIDLAVVFMSDQVSNQARVSFKVIEYLAMNIPVVGQVVGETKAHFGKWVTEANQIDLHKKISEMCTKGVPRNSRDEILPFSWQNHLNSLEDAINHVMKEKRCN